MKRTTQFVGIAASAILFSLAGAGLTAAPAAAEKLFFEGDMVRGHVNPKGPVCVLTSQFKHNEMIVWRVRVFGSSKDDQLADGDLKGVVVELSDGQQRPMRFGSHPPKNSTDSFWSATWVIPSDYPTGSFSYKVVATDGSGNTHTWKPFDVAPSQLTVVADASQK